MRYIKGISISRPSKTLDASRAVRRVGINPSDPDALVTEPQLAAKWGFTAQTLGAWRRRGVGPRAVRTSEGIRYRRQDILDWMDEHRVSVR